MNKIQRKTLFIGIISFFTLCLAPSFAFSLPRTKDNTSTPSATLSKTSPEMAFPPSATQITDDAKPLPETPESAQTASPAECGFMPCIPLMPLPTETVYTVKSDAVSLKSQASHWGIKLKQILTLNPHLNADSMLNSGDKILVDKRHSDGLAAISKGKANKGRLLNARPMPEGNGYFLRDHRPASWGTDTMIQSLITVFDAYSKAFPDAPRINIGDLSRQRGGKLHPHKSHQSGRDIDFGFVHQNNDDDVAKQRFTRAARANLDVEKTWFLVEQLARTGNVEVIYVDNLVQKLLYQYASSRLTPEQREFFFSLPRHSQSSNALLRHWPGHRNHFHVRFKCPTGQPSCR